MGLLKFVEMLVKDSPIKTVFKFTRVSVIRDLKVFHASEACHGLITSCFTLKAAKREVVTVDAGSSVLRK